MSEYTIYGNYDTQELDKFPLDCEGMATMQDNIKLLAAMALLTGVDKLILTGCTVSGSRRTAGYVYVRTGSNLIGEILYHPAQNNSTTCYIKEENISITANNETFSNAYTKRYLADGTGTSSMYWSSFVNVSEIGNYALKNAINAEVLARTNAINDEASNRNSAISTAIATEVSNRNSAISTAIATEASNRNSAISTAIATEVSNRNSAIATEASNRDSAISTAITTAETSLTNAINGKANTNHSHTFTTISGYGEQSGSSSTMWNYVKDIGVGKIVSCGGIYVTSSTRYLITGAQMVTSSHYGKYLKVYYVTNDASPSTGYTEIISNITPSIVKGFHFSLTYIN